MLKPVFNVNVVKEYVFNELIWLEREEDLPSAETLKMYHGVENAGDYFKGKENALREFLQWFELEEEYKDYKRKVEKFL